ncbi:6-phosphogluconolactonase [Leptospira sp. 96542]|nr:6-phosphogluconolactonase [Leptospira sp. 96542]
MNEVKSNLKEIKTFSRSAVWQSHILMEIKTIIVNNQSNKLEPKKNTNIIISGGMTPIPIYQKLHQLKVDWSSVNFWLADERCVPLSHSDSNFLQIFQVIDVTNLKPFKFINMFDGKSCVASKNYSKILQKVEVFDLAILGIGEDGHTASLFPGNELGESSNSADVLFVNNSPKPPEKRITLSLNKINQTDHILFLVSGSKKREIIDRILTCEDLPASKVKGRKTTTIYYLMENQ